MRVVPNGQSEYHNGNEVLRYGRDTESNEVYATWYHDGLRSESEPAWAMDTDVEWKVSVSVDTILVADAEDGLYAIDREAFAESVETLDDREQCIARASDEFVTYVGDPNDHLRGHLWITPENAHGGYHQDKNH